MRSSPYGNRHPSCAPRLSCSAGNRRLQTLTTKWEFKAKNARAASAGGSAVLDEATGGDDADNAPSHRIAGEDYGSPFKTINRGGVKRGRRSDLADTLAKKVRTLLFVRTPTQRARATRQNLRATGQAGGARAGAQSAAGAGWLGGGPLGGGTQPQAACSVLQARRGAARWQAWWAGGGGTGRAPTQAAQVARSPLCNPRKTSPYSTPPSRLFIKRN
jgi:hypothetical protein